MRLFSLFLLVGCAPDGTPLDTASPTDPDPTDTDDPIPTPVPTAEVAPRLVWVDDMGTPVTVGETLVRLDTDGVAWPLNVLGEFSPSGSWTYHTNAACTSPAWVLYPGPQRAFEVLGGNVHYYFHPGGGYEYRPSMYVAQGAACTPLDDADAQRRPLRLLSEAEPTSLPPRTWTGELHVELR